MINKSNDSGHMHSSWLFQWCSCETLTDHQINTKAAYVVDVSTYSIKEHFGDNKAIGACIVRIFIKTPLHNVHACSAVK